MSVQSGKTADPESDTRPVWRFGRSVYMNRPGKRTWTNKNFWYTRNRNITVVEWLEKIYILGLETDLPCSYPDQSALSLRNGILEAEPKIQFQLSNILTLLGGPLCHPKSIFLSTRLYCLAARIYTTFLFFQF